MRWQHRVSEVTNKAQGRTAIFVQRHYFSIYTILTFSYL